MGLAGSHRARVEAGVPADDPRASCGCVGEPGGKPVAHPHPAGDDGPVVVHPQGEPHDGPRPHPRVHGTLGHRDLRTGLARGRRGRLRRLGRGGQRQDGRRTEVVREVAAADRILERVQPGHRRGVLVLPGGGDARRGVGPRLSGVEPAVAVGVAGDQRRHDAAVVHQRDLRDRDVARVVDHVRPGDGRAGRDVGAGCGVGVLSVRELLHVDPGHDAEVVGRIAVAHLGAGRVGAHHRGRVVVLAGSRGARPDALHVGAHGERRRGARDGHAAIVGHGDRAQRGVARVVDGVHPVHGVADADGRSGCGIGVVAVGALLEVDARCDAVVVRGIGVAARDRPPRSPR